MAPTDQSGRERGTGMGQGEDGAERKVDWSWEEGTVLAGAHVDISPPALVHVDMSQ